MVALNGGQPDPSPGGRVIILRYLPALVKSSSQLILVAPPRAIDGSKWEAIGTVVGCGAGEGASALKSRELCWVAGSGVPSTTQGWLLFSPNKLLATGGCCSLSVDVGRDPDLSFAGDNSASPSVRFWPGASPDEGRTTRLLNVEIAPLDLEYCTLLVLMLRRRKTKLT
ncbi:hypothetical protein VCV18_012566 [Metarhizium anisopliae]